MRVLRVLTVACAGVYVSATGIRAAEVIYSESFDAPGVKAGQSILEPPFGWQWVSPAEPAKKDAGNILLGAGKCGTGKYGLAGNYLDGATATIPESENVIQKPFTPIGGGQVVLSCKAFAAGESSATSQISLRPAQGRYSVRAGGWISTPKGWDFFVGRVTSSRWPLGEEKPGAYQIERDGFCGAHDVGVELQITVDLDRNKAWGEAHWLDPQGESHEFKSKVMDWDSAAGNVANVLVSMDRRGGRTGIALDDVRLEGEPSKPKPNPFGQQNHVVRQLNGEKEPISRPGEIQWINKTWEGRNAQVPYLVYMPEKDRLLMTMLTGKPNVSAALTTSDDHGKTWGKRRWLSVDDAGNPNGSPLGLTYLGQGKLLTFGEDMRAPFWKSDDFGETWSPIALKSPAVELYSWDPVLPVKDGNGRVVRLAQGCWKPTGIPWGSAEAPYSQGYFRTSDDGAQTWTEAVKVPQWLGVNEVSMLIAKNGDWVAACRTDAPKRFAHNAFDHYSGLGVSISRDQGKTWSDLNILYEWGRHHPSMVLLPDGRIVMSYVVRLGYPDAENGYPRFGVEAVLSKDNGQTWSLDRRYVLAEWTGNMRGEDGWYCGVQSSATVVLPDGTLLTAFGAGFQNMPAAELCIMDVATVRWRLE